MNIIPSWRLIAPALIVGLVTGGAFCWWVTSISYDADIATLNNNHAMALKAISDKATADSEAGRSREHDFQARIGALDAQHTQELNDEKAKNTRLLADVTAGRRRVQFANAALATCEQSEGTVRSASGMGDATAVRLTPTAGQNILSIRAGINEDQAKLVYLQEYIQALQVQGVIAK